jgi:hypothetical protein
VIEALTSMLADAEPCGYGVCEPTARAWDSAELNSVVLSRPASRTSVILTGPPELPMALTLRVEPRQGTRAAPKLAALTETASGLIGLGRLESQLLAERWRRLPEALVALARAGQVTFALLLARKGNSSLTRPPILPPAAAPVALALGSELLDYLEVDRARARSGASTVSPVSVIGAQGEALVYQLASGRGRPGAPLASVLREIGWEKADAGMGLPEAHIQAVWDAARF